MNNLRALLAGMAVTMGMAEGAAAQGAPHKVDSKKTDEAVRKGIDFLKRTNAGGELVLWTYLHAGLTEQDSPVKVLLEKMLLERPARTYNVALQAMILEKLDRVKYQKRIFDCAQFLVDNQWDYGQWGYGAPTKQTEPPAGIPVPKVSTPGRKPRVLEPDEKAVKVRLPVMKQVHDPHTPGDNSNTQYAHLGLRACHDAGIVFPAETIARADKSWRQTQASVERKAGEVATGGRVAEGWRYSPANQDEKGPVSGSMTVGGLGGLAILDYIQGKNWKADEDVLNAVNWIAANFTVTENPGRGEIHLYYYLYGLERAGILFETEHFGVHEWYPLGVRVILQQQGPDGSWVGGKGKPAVDTCFAILFLRRATRPLKDVASVDRVLPKK